MRSCFVIGVGLVLMMTTGCDVDERLNRLEKGNGELKAEVQKNREVADYDLQAKCSKDAREWFNRNWSRDKDTVLLDFRNHYSKVKNKCFISVEYHYSMGPGASWTNDIMLYDVYENVKYADYSESHYIDFKNPARDEVTNCEVQGQKCTTIGEFNDLTGPFLNN